VDCRRDGVRGKGYAWDVRRLGFEEAGDGGAGLVDMREVTELCLLLLLLCRLELDPDAYLLFLLDREGFSFPGLATSELEVGSDCGHCNCGILTEGLIPFEVDSCPRLSIVADDGVISEDTSLGNVETNY
jgi:hypothetical protein